MERVPYRRVMPSRNQETYGRTRYGRNERQEPDGVVTPGETVIMQCIVCGVLIVAVLIITMVDIAQPLREGLRQALAGAYTVDELVTGVRNFGDEFIVPTFAPDEAPTTFEFPPIPLIPNATSPEYYYPLTSVPELSKPQSPGTSAAPGLWD